MTTPKRRYDLSGDADSLVPQLEDMRLRSMAARRSRDWSARLNLAFYRGYQWLVIDGQDDRFRRAEIDVTDPNAPVLVKINKIGGIVDRSIAKLTKGSPVPECRPVSGDDDDIRSSRVGTRILASEWDRLAMETAQPELYGWVTPTGFAYLHPYWDPKAGPIVGKSNGKQIHRGEVCLDIVPHFEITHDLNAKGIKYARWVIRTTLLVEEEVYERYGIEVQGSATARNLTDDLSALGDYSGSTEQRGSRVAVHQLWIPPGRMRSRPEGLVMTYAGKEILEAPKKFPYDHGTPPFAQFNYLPPLGSPWGRTPVDDMIDPQMDYNDSRSREAAIRRVLIPKLIAPQGSIDAEKIEARVEHISYLPMGAKPDLLMPDARWMTQWETAMDRADAEMGERTGINEAAKGQLTGTSPAATVLAQQEAAAEPLGLPAKELAKGVKETGWQILMLARQYWDEERVVRTWSQSGHLEVHSFKGSDIAEQLDVHVSTESALPRSKAGRANLYMELHAAEIIDAQTLIRGLDLPQTDVLLDVFNRDTREAEWVLGELVAGRIPEVKPWQDFAEHLDVINSYRKTNEYRELEEEIQGNMEGYASVLESLSQAKLAAANPAPPALDVPDAMIPGGPMAALGGAQTPGLPNQTPIPTTTQLAGITGGVAGMPGPVPGVTPDQQAMSMGS